MPRIGDNVTPEELAMCRRIHSARIRAGLSQPALSARTGLTLDQIASIEYGRTVIRFSAGDSLCHVLNISPRWLVEGHGDEQPHVRTGYKLRLRIPKDSLYSQAYYQFLKPLLERHSAKLADVDRFGGDVAEALKSLNLSWTVGERDGTDALKRLIQPAFEAFKNLPPHLAQDLYSLLIKQIREFTSQHAMEIKSLPPTPLIDTPGFGNNKSLDISDSLWRNLPRMAPITTIDELLKRIAKIVRQNRKKRSAIASEVNVAPARITEWLDGKKEPGGKNTLELCKWVYAEESKNKSLEHADTRSRPKTRKRPSNEKKQQSKSSRSKT